MEDNDTMKPRHKACHETATKIANLFDGTHQDEINLQQANRIQQESADCGYSVLSYMEIEACSSFSGPACIVLQYY